jgi:thioredoxin-related protein
MKKIITFLFLLSPIFLLAQDSIKLQQLTITEAVKVSKKENKPIFYMCFAAWCAHCNKMKSEVFKDTAVAAFYNKTFICAGLDMEKGEGMEVKREVGLRNYPTYLFMDSTGTVLYRTGGEFKPNDLIAEGKKALHKEHQLPYLKKQFEDDSTNPNKCLNYIMALRKGDIDPSEPAKKYLNTQTEQQLISVPNWRIIANGINRIDSREFQFVINHQREFAAITSIQRIDKKFTYVANELLQPLVAAKDTDNYFRLRPLVINMKNVKVDSIVFMLDIALAESVKRWDIYKTITSGHGLKFCGNDYFTLNHMANVYLQNMSDTNSLRTAIEWMNQSLKLKEEYDSYLIAAKLFFKLSDKKSALAMASKAKELAIIKKWNAKDAELLIEQWQ